MIRELAENPNVHQPLGPQRTLHLDDAGRFAVFLSPGTSARVATVQRVRLTPTEVEPALEEIRALLRSQGREGAEWELGESCTPLDLVERLLGLGLRLDNDPVAYGMVLREPELEPPPGVEARPVASFEDLLSAREVQRAAFGDPSPVDDAQVRADYAREGIDGTTFVALVDGQIVAAAYASRTPHGTLLFGGATLPSARGRGAYRALVAARAADARANGVPVLVTHAGRMSRPILERLGFVAVARIDRLLDELS